MILLYHNSGEEQAMESSSPLKRINDDGGYYGRPSPRLF